MEVLVQTHVIAETIINYHDCLNGFRGGMKIIDNWKLWKQTNKQTKHEEKRGVAQSEKR